MLENYVNAPNEYGEVSFYWWVGEKLTKERLLWQLEKLSQRNICALQINYCHSNSGGRIYGLTIDNDPKLFTEEWWELVNWFMQECKKRNIAVALSDYTLEPPGQGYYMDEIIKKHPEVTGKMLVYEDGRVQVRPVPYSVDPMNKNLGNYVIEEFYGQFDRRFPGEGGKGLNFFFSDELAFNIRGNLWNDAFAGEFIKRKGYDLVPQWEAIFVDIGDETEKIRLDYYDVIVQLIEEGYFIPIYNWNQDRGMTFGCDHGGRGRDITEFGDYFRTQRWVQGPGNDQPNLSSDIIKTKVSSSIAHLYNRPRTWLEGYYGSGWGTSTNELADATFRNFCLGHNLLTLHGLYYTTYGGFWEWAPPCNHFRMPYWKHMDQFLECTKRLSYLMTRGRHVCDVAILYPVAAMEGGKQGEEAVNTAFAIGEALYTHSIDFDFMDFESLNRAEVSQQALHVSGEEYKAVIVPSMGTIRYQNLVKLHEFSQKGGLVYFVGELPSASDRQGRNDSALNQLVAEILVQNHRLHTPEEVLSALQSAFTPDINGPEHPFILHRRIDRKDVYMVYGAKKDSPYFFRATGKVCLFDPWTGREQSLGVISQDATGTRLNMPLTESEVQIIAFDPQECACPAKEEKSCSTQSIEGSWDFELLPTMDNRYGDYAQPPTPKTIGAQARFFQFQQGDRKKEIMCSYQSYFKKFGPYSAPCDEAVLADAGGWDYDFSMRYGLWMDPGPQDSYHGLKGKVTDEFLVFGSPQVSFANSQVDYLPEPEGSYYYLKTEVYASEDKTVFSHTGTLKPEKIYLDGQPVTGDSIHLTKGIHPVLLRYAGVGRTYFILHENREPQVQCEPLAMAWHNNKGLLPFAPKLSGEPCSFSFTAPPALLEMQFTAHGQTVQVYVDGQEMPVQEKAGQYNVQIDAPKESPSKVTVLIQPLPGVYEGAIPEPVDLICGKGNICLGDWAEIDGLGCYSGGARYSKQIKLESEQDLVLDLGDVGCSAEVFVNGASAGIRMTKPYTFHIGSLCQKGSNSIAVEVYNTLYNHYRTIPTHYNQRPQPSGLLGPVTLSTVHKAI